MFGTKIWVALNPTFLIFSHLPAETSSGCHVCCTLHTFSLQDPCLFPQLLEVWAGEITSAHAPLGITFIEERYLGQVHDSSHSPHPMTRVIKAWFHDPN